MAKRDSSRSKRAIALRDPMAEAGRKLLARQVKRMKSHEAGSRSGVDIEDVHQMRVAIRRMRSLFNLLEAFYRTKTLARQTRGLRQVARALGRIRDLDVLILDLEDFGATLPDEERPALESAIAMLDQRRRRYRQGLNEFFDSKRYRRFVRRLERFCKRQGRGALPVAAIESPHQARHALPPLLHETLARVRAYDSALPAVDDVILHELRVEFKQLRYALEFFEPLLGKSAADFLRDARDMQDSLGRIHDIAVFCEYTRGLKRLSPEQAAVLQRYATQRESELIDLRAGFNEQWRAFYTRRRQRQFSDALLTLR